MRFARRWPLALLVAVAVTVTFSRGLAGVEDSSTEGDREARVRAIRSALDELTDLDDLRLRRAAAEASALLEADRARFADASTAERPDTSAALSESLLLALRVALLEQTPDRLSELAKEARQAIGFASTLRSWEREDRLDEVDTVRRLCELGAAGGKGFLESRRLDRATVSALRAGDFAAAAMHARARDRLLVKLLGDEHIDRTTALSYEAYALGALGRDGEALRALDLAVRLRRARSGESPHPQLATLEYLAAQSCERLSDHEGAHARYDRARSQRALLFGEDDPRTLLVAAHALAPLARLEDRARLDTACDRFLSLHAAAPVATLAARAEPLRRAAKFLEAAHAYEASARFSRELVRVHERLHGDTDPSVADALRRLADAERRGGRPDASRRSLLRAVAIYRQSDPADPRLAYALDALGKSCRELARYTEGEAAHTQALELLRRLRGPEDREALVVLNNLAVLLDHKGDHDRARRCHEEALHVRRRTLPPEHPDIAYSLDNLASLFRLIGDLDQALLLGEEAVSLREKIHGDDSHETATALDNLGSIRAERHELREALSLYERALAIRKRLLRDHVSTAITHNNLGVTLRSLDRLDEASDQFRRAAEIHERLDGGDSWRAAVTRVNQGLLDLERGEEQRAVETLRASRRRLREQLGERHPRLIGVERSLGLALLRAGHAAETVAAATRSLELANAHLETLAATQDEREQLAVLADSREALGLLLSVPDGVSPRKAWEATLGVKGGVFLRQRRLRAGRDETTEALYSRLRVVARELLREASSSSSRAARERSVGELEEERSALERRLADADSRFRSSLDRARRSADELRGGLPDDACVLDFVVYDRQLASTPRPASERHLAAFLVRREECVRTELGPLAPIERLIEAHSRELRGVSEGEARGPGTPTPRTLAPVDERAAETSDGESAARALRRALWVPLETTLRDGDRIAISPDGPLWRVPFAALPGSAPGRFLIEERELCVIPFAQALLATDSRGTAEARWALLAVGGVDYESGPDPGPRESVSSDTTRDSLTGGSSSTEDGERESSDGNETDEEKPDVSDGVDAKEREDESPPTRDRYLAPIRLRPTTLAPLPHSLEEVRALERLARTLGSGATQILVGANAIESAVSQALPHARRAHFATHGFLARTGAADAQGRTRFDRWHPGLLGGIALSGATSPVIGSDDGILTALELSTLDLSATELLVLSACDTARGEEVLGEGLIGLARAAHVAGASSVLASLWPVRDLDARALMDRFYRHLLADGKPPASALRLAQLAMLRGELEPDGSADGSSDRGPGRARSPRSPSTTETLRVAPTAWAGWILSSDRPWR